MAENDPVAAAAAINISELDSGADATAADALAGAALTDPAVPDVLTVDEAFQACKALLAGLPDQSSVNQVMNALRNVFGG